MKKSIIAMSIGAVLFIGYTHAEYMVKFKLDGDINVTEWSATNTLYGEWTNIGNIYDCSNWSPSPSTITIGMNFQQTANDCQQNQERSAQDQEVDKLSGSVRNLGAEYVDKQIINVLSYRNSIGTLENWIATTPTYGSWTNSGAIYGCSNWSPAASSGNVGTNVTQTATNCSQNQTRTVQNREIETNTGVLRNTTLTSENHTLTGQTSTQTVAGTTPVEVCAFSATAPVTMWELVFSGLPSDTYPIGTSITFNGVLVYSVGSSLPPTTTTITTGGYTYTRSTLQSGQGKYRVCRK